MPDQVAGCFASVLVNDMDPDHFNLESSSIRKNQHLDDGQGKDDPDHDLVAEELDEFFAYDESNGAHGLFQSYFEVSNTQANKYADHQ